MKNNEELYNFIDELVEELTSLDEKTIAERVKNAKNISSIGTEIFMALRLELENLRKSDIRFTMDTRQKIAESIRDINKALR